MDSTTLPPTNSRPSAERPAPQLCNICRQPMRWLKRSRCDACYAYWRKYGRERPLYLWGRCFTGRLGA
jgi:hypothetical protein